MNTEIPHLKIERLANGCIRLENEAAGESYVVDIHPLHLRYMAEKLGLAREMSASEADALRTIDKLARRLNVLHDRIYQMDRWLWEHPDATDADISIEIWYSAATLELSNEFQAEIAESHQVTPRRASVASKPSGNPEQTKRVMPLVQHPLQMEAP